MPWQSHLTSIISDRVEKWNESLENGFVYSFLYLFSLKRIPLSCGVSLRPTPINGSTSLSNGQHWFIRPRTTTWNQCNGSNRIGISL